VTFLSRSLWLLGRCLLQLRKSCAGGNMIYWQAERVFVCEHYFTPKYFASLREGFVCEEFPDKEVPNKSIQELVTLRDTESVFSDKCSSRDKTVEITAVQNSSSASAETTGYVCKNSVYQLVSLFWAWRCWCAVASIAFQMELPVSKSSWDIAAACLPPSTVSPMHSLGNQTWSNGYSKGRKHDVYGSEGC
jgi:hypothetical protein